MPIKAVDCFTAEYMEYAQRRPHIKKKNNAEAIYFRFNVSICKYCTLVIECKTIGYILNYGDTRFLVCVAEY